MSNAPHFSTTKSTAVVAIVVAALTSACGVPAEDNLGDVEEAQTAAPCMTAPLAPTSPPPLGGGAVYQAPPKPGDPTVGACNFYGKPIANPGGCSAYDKALLGGYNQTCLNVTNGYGIPYTNGSMCALNTKYRRWADAMRFCLQSSTSSALNKSLAAKKCVTCDDAVNEIATSHSSCNAATGFCSALQDPAAAWCFGQSLGNAWGPFLTGTCNAGPAAPIGLVGMMREILKCGLSAPQIQNDLCKGYVEACVKSGAPSALCTASCFPLMSRITNACLPGFHEVATNQGQCNCPLNATTPCLADGNQCVKDACPQGDALCSGTCVSLKSDVKNCGACGHACPAGEVCSNGSCATSCSSNCTKDSDCPGGTCLTIVGAGKFCKVAHGPCPVNTSCPHPPGGPYQECFDGTCWTGICAL